MRATYIKTLDNWRGDARLYELSVPIPYDDWAREGRNTKRYARYVVVSAVVFDGPETYIFHSNRDGETYHMLELPGSQKGTLSHDKVLQDLGYNVGKDEG